MVFQAPFWLIGKSPKNNNAVLLCISPSIPHSLISDGFRPNSDDVAACRSLFALKKEVLAFGIKVFL